MREQWRCILFRSNKIAKVPNVTNAGSSLGGISGYHRDLPFSDCVSDRTPRFPRCSLLACMSGATSASTARMGGTATGRRGFSRRTGDMLKSARALHLTLVEAAIPSRLQLRKHSRGLPAPNGRAPEIDRKEGLVLAEKSGRRRNAESSSARRATGQAPAGADQPVTRDDKQTTAAPPEARGPASAVRDWRTGQARRHRYLRWPVCPCRNSGKRTGFARAGSRPWGFACVGFDHGIAKVAPRRIISNGDDSCPMTNLTL
jgi:hypothetical protein